MHNNKIKIYYLDFFKKIKDEVYSKNPTTHDDH